MGVDGAGMGVLVLDIAGDALRRLRLSHRYTSSEECGLWAANHDRRMRLAVEAVQQPPAFQASCGWIALRDIGRRTRLAPLARRPDSINERGASQVRASVRLDLGRRRRRNLGSGFLWAADREHDGLDVP